MRFFSEQLGAIWEFNSFSEYIGFMFGRLLGFIIFFGILGLIIWFLA